MPHTSYLMAPLLRTTVIGSYPFPGWLEFASQNLDKFGEADREELIDDAVTIAIHDQLEAGLDVITDGEQTRLDFNLSFYGFLEGIDLETALAWQFGPPAHDQRPRYRVTSVSRSPLGRSSARFRAAETAGASRTGPQSQPPRALHPERAAHSRQPVPGSICADGGPAADRASGAGGSCHGRGPRNHGR